jgi:hypothetical protein
MANGAKRGSKKASVAAQSEVMDDKNPAWKNKWGKLAWANGGVEGQSTSPPKINQWANNFKIIDILAKPCKLDAFLVGYFCGKCKSSFAHAQHERLARGRGRLVTWWSHDESG